jgi:hypothetical protein
MFNMHIRCLQPFFFFFFGETWYLNSGFHTCKAEPILLEPCLQPFTPLLKFLKDFSLHLEYNSNAS